MRSLTARIRAHPLADCLFRLRRTALACVLTEPFFGIPHSLISPYVTLYMYALGVSERQIGLLLSLSLIPQVLFSLGGGMLSDKYGRKPVTIWGDVVGWVIPCLIWAAAGSFWFFLAAMLLNSVELVNQTAWRCLLTEDVEDRHMVNLFTWITIAGLLAVFFAPVSGLLVGRYSLVPVMRLLYVLFSISMIVKDIIMIRFTSETSRGLSRREEFRHVSLGKLAAGYRKVLPKISSSPATLQTLLILVAVFATNLVATNFFGLYASGHLGLPEQYLAYYPILRAVVMILFLVGIQHLLERFHYRRPMQIGFLLYIACQLLLILGPKSPVTAGVYVVLEAVAAGLVVPRKDSMLATQVDAEERARLVALITALPIALSIPFGYLAGALAARDLRLPFAFNTLFYLAALAIVTLIRPAAKAEDLGDSVPKPLPPF